MPVSLRKYYKRSRKLILTRYKKLKDENKQACDLMLHYSEDLRLAHRMKEWFYDICQMEAYRQQQREFDDWIANAQSCGIKEFEACAKTYRAWRKEILNAFKYGLTNGPTEGFNNKIKVLKRSSYGIRNFKRFRTRILHCTSLDKMAGNAEAYLACPKSVKPGTKHKKGPFHRIGAGF